MLKGFGKVLAGRVRDSIDKPDFNLAKAFQGVRQIPVRIPGKWSRGARMDKGSRYPDE